MLTEITPPPVLVAKRAHKKSRLGCSQCKLRKIKCDERRPLCKNCEKHYKAIEKCDFLSSSAPTPGANSSTGPQIIPPRPRPCAKKQPISFRKGVHVFLPITPSSELEPFNCLPDCNIPNTQLLLHHYLQNFVSRSFPVHLDHPAQPLMQSLWSLASSDAVLFHATLQLSALDLDALRGGGQDAQTNSSFLLNKECITLLRQRVEDPVLGLSDQTIASVLFLIIVEFERSNFRMVNLHIQGLKRMVSLRGGLTTIRASNHTLANLIFGITLTVTTEVQFQPETPLEASGANDPLELLASDPRLFRLDNVGLAKGHVQVLKVLRYMTNVAEMEWPDNAAPTKCSEIMARTMSLPEPLEDGPLTASISESMRLAAVSICFLPFKNDYPSPELMINTMIHKLRSSLETMLSLAPQDHPLLPWLLSVGGIYSTAPERNWFIGHLVPVVGELEIRSWEDMRSHLTKVIWMQYFCEVPFRELWEEVEAKRKDLDLVDLDVWQ